MTGVRRRVYWPDPCKKCGVPQARDAFPSRTIRGAIYPREVCRSCDSARVVRDAAVDPRAHARWKTEEQRRQTASLATSTASGSLWTDAEDEAVLDMTRTAEQLAIDLNRTTFAVQRRRYVVRRRGGRIQP